MFTERRTLARMIRLSPGASFRVAGRSIYFAYSGTGRVEREPLRTFTAAFLDHGEDATFAADTEIEMLHLGMPDLRELVVQQPDAHAVAAE
jgi:hypothetical protein